VAFFQWRYKNPKRSEDEKVLLARMIAAKFDDLHNLGEKREQMRQVREAEKARLFELER
jgi:hypothetical protein